ncbi:MAG: aminotransferase class I and II [Limnospira sp. PMC 1291.21]|uniref:LL-diaminopimelate aminotransferase n=3 Tax=Limnospira TaxID=2596745 RepID=A0A9P1KJB0_9CYAN|nr:MULTISPECIES: hypothetical protein [Limnospira]EKD08140.1 aminotransferase class I and II [Arthrospira platensis C1]QJB25209.1 aminotransferase class I and II [Limnospira fusiformis SAG 85.79]EDZ92382.1 hypothetical protein AmaxDRAFT_4869 [Limnospira maxima CS-328]MDT9176866.1 aminotransferase class I and II [Limnospira sp. PMC 1238.20]MDT9188890.1 aminotransferase class I and II [Limnospira sp. PMC 894.15]
MRAVPYGDENGYGAAGEGFIRMALTNKESRIQEAIDRMRNAGITYQ